MAKDVIGDLFKSADELKGEKEALLKDIDANRKALRTMKDAGALTPEQSKKVDELYPPRGGNEAPAADAS